MISFKEYLEEKKSCPEGTSWCSKCNKCKKITCDMKKVEEGVGLTVAKVIDKTKPPLGRPSKRRAVSTALKMRQIMKDTEENKKRKFSGKAAVAEDWQKKSGSLNNFF